MSTKHTPGPTMRARFIRREMGKALTQADFNRAHYSDAEAFCWDATAAECLQALGGIASNWFAAIDERAKATGAAA